MAKQWVRWYVEFLHDPKKTVLSLAEVGIWSLLMLLAGANSQQDGRLRVCEGVPYTPESLAAALGLRPGEAELVGPALEKFRRLKMIEIEEDGTILLINYMKRQYDHPSDRPEATRARKAMSRQSKEEVTSMSRGGHEEVTSMSRPLTEQNRSDQIIDLDRSVAGVAAAYTTNVARVAKTVPEKPPAPAAPPELISLFEKETGKRLTSMQVKEISSWTADFVPELIQEALRRAVIQGKPSLFYIGQILQAWRAAGLHSLPAVLEKDPLGKKPAAAPDQPSPAAREDRRREEKIRAARDYIIFTLGDNPDPAAAAEIARGYSEDEQFVAEVLARLKLPPPGEKGGVPP